MAKEITESVHLWTWLKTMSRKLFELDHVPLLATLPFPWDSLSTELSKCFGISNLKIEPKELQWRDEKQTLKNFEKPLILAATSSGFDGKAFFIMSSSDVELLMKRLLKLESAECLNLPHDVVESFFRFLAVEGIASINQIDYDSKFSFSLSANTEEITTPQLCQDVVITAENDKITARVCLDPDFRSSLQNYASQAHAIKPSDESLEALQFTMGIEIGRTELGLDELLRAKTGDFLIIEQALTENKCLITLEGKPFFHANIQNGNLQILELALYNEVYGSMVAKNPTGNTPNPNEENDIEEEAEASVYDENENPFPEEDEEAPVAGVEASQDDDDEFELKEEAPPAKTKPKAEPKAEKAAKVAPSQVVRPEKAPISKKEKLGIEDVPVTLSVELAQLQMSAKKLLELQPGNTLDLALSPDSSALLVVNGKIVGRGEILKIGETLGVRILELGSS